MCVYVCMSVVCGLLNGTLTAALEDRRVSGGFTRLRSSRRLRCIGTSGAAGGVLVHSEAGFHDGVRRSERTW